MSYQRVNFILLLGSIVGLLFALYLQYVEGYEPCPLCIFQRIGLIVVGLASLMALVHRPKLFLFRRGYILLATLGILWSVGVAARHVWLQNLPADKVPACGAGLDYMMETFPVMQVLSTVLQGSGECAVIDWTFLGQSLPVWSLLYFGLLAVIALWQLFRGYPK